MRSVQNANEADLQSFASIISESKLHSRFFSTYPNADFNLVEWLYSWMKKGKYACVLALRSSINTTIIVTFFQSGSPGVYIFIHLRVDKFYRYSSIFLIEQCNIFNRI